MTEMRIFSVSLRELGLSVFKGAFELSLNLFIGRVRNLVFSLQPVLYHFESNV